MPNCPICHFSKSKYLFPSSNIHGHHRLDNQSIFDLHQCQECQTIFLKNISPDQSYYQKFYPPNYYVSSLSNFYSKFILFLKSKQLVSLFKRFPVSILDIGCGDGNFLQSLNPTKFQKYGLDINPESIRICQKKGIKMTDLSTKQRFDIVTLNHVLEHLPDPHSSLAKISKILKPQGFLLISIPNCSSLGFKLGHQYWFHLDSPRHLFIPNQKSLTILLEKHGFKILKISNNFLEFPLDLFWSVRHHPLSLLIHPLYPIIKFFNPETITILAKLNS